MTSSLFLSLSASLVTPSIVTDSLILHLDSANTESYPGTGTTWFDISGNNNDFNTYTSQNGLGALPYSNDVFTFEGVDGYNTDFANTTSSQLHLSPSGDRTIEVWFKILNMPNRDASSVVRDNKGVIVGNRSGENGCLNIKGGGINKITWNWDDSSDTYSNTTILENTWYQAVILLRNINNVTYYINGALDTSEFVSSDLYNAGLPDTVQNWTIGKSERGFAAAALTNGYTYLGTNMQVGIFRQYDRLLSASEISQNFDAQRNRFGI